MLVAQTNLCLYGYIPIAIPPVSFPTKFRANTGPATFSETFIRDGIPRTIHHSLPAHNEPPNAMLHTQKWLNEPPNGMPHTQKQLSEPPNGMPHTSHKDQNPSPGYATYPGEAPYGFQCIRGIARNRCPNAFQRGSSNEREAAIPRDWPILAIPTVAAK